MLEELELLQIIMVLLTFVIFNKELVVNHMIVGLVGLYIVTLVVILLQHQAVLLLFIMVLLVLEVGLGMELQVRVELKQNMVLQILV